MFGDGSVKAQLDWPRIDDLSFQVVESFSQSREYLGNMMTVWYVDPAGLQADWWSEGARPMTVREAAQGQNSWLGDRRSRIAKFKKEFIRCGRPVRLVLPSYAVRRDTQLILDGTHRSVAVYAAEIPVRLFVFTLQGLIEEATLPDLRHYL
jgi:hypothetical protein